MKKLIFFINVLSIISFTQTKQFTIPGCVDISLNEIILQDTISSRIVLGAENIIPSQYAPPFEFKFLNKHKTQLLTCTFHPGDYLYSLSEFKVEMMITDESKLDIDSLGSKIVVLEDILSFKSGKNIEIGIDVSEVIKILGKPIHIDNEEGSDIFQYELKNPRDYPDEKPEPMIVEFLNSFGSHLYYGNYKFRNGKLIEFSFGFPYP